MKKNEDMLTMLLARAEQATAEKHKVMHFTTETLGEVEIVRPPLSKITDWLDEVNDRGNLSTFDNLLYNAEIIYESCPFLKANYEKLAEAYNEKDFARLVVKIFQTADAVGELSDMAEQILSSYGIFKEAIKN